MWVRVGGCVGGRECVNGKTAVWALVGGCSVQCPPKLKPGGLPFTNGIPWRYSWNFIMWPEPTLIVHNPPTQPLSTTTLSLSHPLPHVITMWCSPSITYYSTRSTLTCLLHVSKRSALPVNLLPTWYSTILSSCRGQAHSSKNKRIDRQRNSDSQGIFLISLYILPSAVVPLYSALMISMEPKDDDDFQCSC